MTKRALMEQKTETILHEVMQISKTIAKMERELRVPHSRTNVDSNNLLEHCAELRARLEDIRNVVEESRQSLLELEHEIEELDLWL